jgi:hypothetical protein
MAPVAKARYLRDANLKALYGISLPLLRGAPRPTRPGCGLLDEDPELFDRENNMS